MSTIDDVRDRLLTLDQVRERLHTTEPLVSYTLTERDRWHLALGWNHDLKALDGAAVVEATIDAAGREWRLSKDAVLEATSLCGLSKPFVQSKPAGLVEPVLNWFFPSGTDQRFQVLVAGDQVVSVAKATVQPFSNLRLLEQVLAGIERRYGAGEVLADAKFHHSLRGTALRLIVPEQHRVIEHTGTDNDTWSVGIEIVNSLSGATPTSLQGYLFRYWCANGATDTHTTSGTWSRKHGQGDEVYEWAGAAVDEVLGGLEHTLDRVQDMADTSIQGETASVLGAVFDHYRLPAAQRQAITTAMVDTTVLTEYTLMQAVTAAANTADLSASVVDQLLQVGGNLPHTLSHRCGSCRQLLS